MSTTAEKSHVLRVLDRTGDTVTEWRPGTKTEEDHAERKFDELAKKGFLMFAIEAPGKTPEQVRTFDPKAFEIVAVPQYQGG